MKRAAFFALCLILACAYGILVVALPQSLLVGLAVPIVVMLLLCLWMLPDRATFSLIAIERVAQIYFILSIVWPAYIAVALPGLPWLTPTRMALFLLTLLFTYSLSTSGILRTRLMRVVRTTATFRWCFLLWEGMQVITLPVSRTVGISVRHLLDNQFSLVGMFFLGCILFTQKGRAAWFVRALILCAIFTALDGFVELRLGYPPWANHIPSFLRIDESMLANVLGSQARSSDGLYRVRGPFVNSLVFAQYLAMCVPFIIHWIFVKGSLYRRLLMIVALVILFGAITVTNSRLGFVGALVGVAGYLLIWAYQTWRSGHGGLLGPAVLLGTPVALLLLFGIILSSHSLTAKVLGNGAHSASDNARRIQREMAIPRVVHNPVGYGLSNSGLVLGYTNPAGFNTVDSFVITTVIDLGVVGLFSFYGMLVLAARRGVGVYLRSTDPEIRLAGPAAISVVVFAVISLVLSQENNMPLMFLLAGVIFALSARDHKTDITV
ncbi:O-antigen ligase family protein (plasmid) [Polymorphobacter sp. PAMC 29334]|uniref:O-antigen ligase family protein n=1 Tax=Polymorphobacter sp. PAMC 29334 TaxID=2862331 RepID=UPI001C6745D8|nr:O-antigen ligase family protein [Polymorphobacter sp. PAMC 29334]QYE33202.1 O-antigen ligase family protein [Polymorphobacter sp. PAMC 29334]